MGFDPPQAGAWQVIYIPAGTGFQRHQPPAGIPEGTVFTSRWLRAEAELTFVPWEAFDVQETLGMGRAEYFAYAEIFETDDSTPRQSLLGHPGLVQGDMQLECQLVHHGL